MNSNEEHQKLGQLFIRQDQPLGRTNLQHEQDQPNESRTNCKAGRTNKLSNTNRKQDQLSAGPAMQQQGAAPTCRQDQLHSWRNWILICLVQQHRSRGASGGWGFAPDPTSFGKRSKSTPSAGPTFTKSRQNSTL